MLSIVLFLGPDFVGQTRRVVAVAAGVVRFGR